MSVIIQHKRATAARWTEKNPKLAAGEAGLETDTQRVKYGDGSTLWNDLPYAAGGGGSSDPTPLLNHINSQTPHPVYDDMQSLVGLYENAKV